MAEGSPGDLHVAIEITRTIFLALICKSLSAGCSKEGTGEKEKRRRSSPRKSKKKSRGRKVQPHPPIFDNLDLIIVFSLHIGSRLSSIVPQVAMEIAYGCFLLISYPERFTTAVSVAVGMNLVHFAVSKEDSLQASEALWLLYLLLGVSAPLSIIFLNIQKMKK